MTGKLFVCIGMIASGKSTYCKMAANKGQLVVNDDAIVNMIHADQYQLYKRGYKPLYKAIENTAISFALAMDECVIFDRGLNISKEARQRPISLAKSTDAYVEAIVFPKEDYEVHAKRRFYSDNRSTSFEEWMEVAKAHEDRFYYPTIAEGFHRINFITWEEICSGKVIS